MKRDWLYNILWNTWFAVATVGIIALGVVLYQTYREYTAFKAKEARLSRQVSQARQDLEHKQQYSQHLTHDPAFMAWLVRERLGYTSPGEVVYRFEGPFNDKQSTQITPIYARESRVTQPVKRQSSASRSVTRH